MGKKMKRSTTEDESSSNSASSTDEISREETAKRRRRRSQARRNTSKTEGKKIIKFLEEVKEEMCKQSKQATESKEEMCIQLEKLREEMCKQSKQATESKEEICKQLEKVKEENQEMRKKLNDILIDLRKQRDLHTNGSSGDGSDATRSQLNQVEPPRYRLEFKSGVTDKIEKGQDKIEKDQIIDISVALVDGYNNQIVENGPLATATVELVVVNAEFNQHDNEYNWSREDFERNIKKERQGNSAAGDADQSVKSIVSNGRFNLVHGAKCHSGSTIFMNSSNKKVRLGVMVVSPTEERVLEGLSKPFFVRGHDRSARQNNLCRKRSNTQRQALVGDGYEQQNGPMSTMQNPSWPNPTQSGGIGLDITGGQPQLPITGNATMLSPVLNITGRQQQFPFLENITMLSTEPSTSQEHQASIQMLAQAMNNQTDELSAALVGNVRNTNFVGNDYALVQATGMPYNTVQRTLPVRLVWDRLVEPIKDGWNLFDHLSVNTVYNKPSNKKLLPNPTRQLFVSRWKEELKTRQTSCCTENLSFRYTSTYTSLRRVQHLNLSLNQCLEGLPTSCMMLTLKQISDCRQRQHRQVPKYMQYGDKSLVYMPPKKIQWLHLWRINLSLSQHLTKLDLLGLMLCEELPQFCQLQVLQILHLEKLAKLRSLCSHVVSTPFPGLRELRLHDLENLEKWVTAEGKEGFVFPVLEKLDIKNCPKLTCLPEAPKLKGIELDEGMSPLSLALVKLRRQFGSIPKGHQNMKSYEGEWADESRQVLRRSAE